MTLFTPDKTLPNLSELGCPNSLQKNRNAAKKISLVIFELATVKPILFYSDLIILR